MSLSQITAITGAPGNAASSWSSSAMKSAAQPVHPRAGGHLERAEHGDLPVLPRGGNLRADRAQRPAGPDVRQQVQVRLVLGQHHRPARQLQQPGHDPRYYVVVVRVAAGDQLRPPPDRDQPDPPV
jgi:hypothetical protein